MPDIDLMIRALRPCVIALYGTNPLLGLFAAAWRLRMPSFLP